MAINIFFTSAKITKQSKNGLYCTLFSYIYGASGHKKPAVRLVLEQLFAVNIKLKRI